MQILEVAVLVLSYISFGSSGDVPILGSSSGPPFDASWVITNSYDNNGGKCYCSQGDNAESAYIYILLADITNIRILNRDFMPERLTGVTVYVCEGSQCNVCGVTPAVAAAQWTTLNCNGAPLRGNVIWFKGTQGNCLSFCEIKVLGTTVGAEVDVLRGFSSPPFNQDWTINEGFHRVGQVSDPRKCYSSQNFNAEATLEIPESEVSSIALLNRFDEDFAYRLEHIKVEVCTKAGVCHFCGEIASTPVSKWGVANCPNGAVLGNKIKLRRDNECLTFCDTRVIVIPKEECVCTDYHRFCPGLHNPSFVSDYKKLLASGSIKNKAEPPTPTCDDAFYQVHCPKSCKKCTC